MALPPPPPGVDLTQNRTPAIQGSLISTLILACAAVAVRFGCRRLTRAAIWWDDWMIVVALSMGSILTLVTLAWMDPYGLGRHIWVAPPDAGEVWAKGLLISNIVYTLCLTATKYSILLFYWRIFKHSSIRLPIYTLFTIVTAWCIAVVLVSVFQCFPLKAFWERFETNISPEVEASFRCPIVQRNFYIANAIPNILTDVAIIILPMPYIWRLKMDGPQKIGISSIFLLSALFSFIFKVDVTDPDITWNFIDSQMWTAIEQHVAIMCACLPSMRPILTFLFNRSPSKWSKSYWKGGSGPTSSSQKSKKWYFENGTTTSDPFSPNRMSKMDGSTLVSISAGDSEDVEMGVIRQTKTFHVERTDGDGVSIKQPQGNSLAL